MTEGQDKLTVDPITLAATLVAVGGALSILAGLVGIWIRGTESFYLAVYSRLAAYRASEWILSEGGTISFILYEGVTIVAVLVILLGLIQVGAVVMWWRQDRVRSLRIGWFAGIISVVSLPLSVLSYLCVRYRGGLAERRRVSLKTN